MAKKRILVVDDNTVNLALLEKELSDKYTIIPMISGRRAIKFLYTEKVDLILMDIQMPVMDGIQTLKEIRKQENGITVPVIFLTASKDKKTVIEGSKLGIMDYIIKPFDVKTLDKRIDQVFKRIGVIPFEQDELYRYLDAILIDINEGHIKQAIIRANEVIQYQVDDEIAGRMANARNKLDSRDIDGAIKTIKRLQKKLEIDMGIEIVTDEQPIGNEEICEDIDDIIVDLNNFRTSDAAEKCRLLRGKNIPDDVRTILSRVTGALVDYDDETAGELLEQLTQQLKK